MPTVGIIANPRAGKDLRRLVAHASVPSDTSRIADLRRMIVGAVEGGADRVLIARDPHGLARRATGGLSIPVTTELVDVEVEGTGNDTARAAAEMRERGAQVLVVSGGDGTMRDVCRGWLTAPMVAVSSGTNNAFSQLVEPTVAGAAAGLVASSGAALEDLIAYRAQTISIEVDKAPPDVALVDVAVVRGDLSGGRSLYSLDGVESILTAVAEPWAVGLSSIAGLVAPTSRTDDRAVLVELDPDAPRRVRAPVAPGVYAEAGLRSVSVVEPGQQVNVKGPAVLALDGERIRQLVAGQRASMTLHRNGPHVIDIRRTFAVAVRRGHFLREHEETT